MGCSQPNIEVLGGTGSVYYTFQKHKTARRRCCGDPTSFLMSLVAGVGIEPTSSGYEPERLPFSLPAIESISQPLCTCTHKTSAILYKEVRAMKKEWKICHGCAQEVYPYAEHWYVRLDDTFVTFHTKCYEHYKRSGALRLKWAVHKAAKN